MRREQPLRRRSKSERTRRFGSTEPKAYNNNDKQGECILDSCRQMRTYFFIDYSYNLFYKLFDYFIMIIMIQYFSINYKKHNPNSFQKFAVLGI
mmetsp:Transcript_7167/g.18012  ORF Transcript_7167/g.18012 Transcript_7167/m.18012 type:complete len:94 (-) Transcript_7167:1503-1784(-)